MSEELQPTAKQLENALKRIADLEALVAGMKPKEEPKPEPKGHALAEVPQPSSTPAPKKKREKLFKFNLFGPIDEDHS